VSLLDLIDQKRPEILRIAAKHGARDVRLFGSVARGEEHEGSDVDLLAEMRSFHEQAELKEELKSLLGVKVDVITTPHPYLRDRVLEEAISLEAPDFRDQAVLQSRRPHPPLDRDNTYLRLMLTHCCEIAEMGMSGRDAFLTSAMVQRAMVMTLILIGENARRISDGVRSAHPEIPWKKIVGFRDISVHDYPSLAFEHVWDDIIQVAVPELRTHLETLLPQ